MPDQRIVQLNSLTVVQLAALDGREYTNAMRMSLRHDVRWARFLDPILVERTRQSLQRMVSSIDTQRLSADLTLPNAQEWLRGINALQRWSRDRLEALPPQPLIPESHTKEIRAWKALSARLAEELDRVAPECLEDFQTPYGGLTLREWLTARKEKEESNA